MRIAEDEEHLQQDEGREESVGSGGANVQLMAEVLSKEDRRHQHREAHRDTVGTREILGGLVMQDQVDRVGHQQPIDDMINGFCSGFIWPWLILF